MKYNNISTADVQQLVLQDDSDAMYEMAWRMTPDVESSPIESCAWQDYWFEKATNAGNIEAKARYARSLRERPPDAEYRKKAFDYFESINADFDAGKFKGNEDLELDGKLSKLWLGVMLCEGIYTPHNPVRGVRLIDSVWKLTNEFEGFGFNILFELGRLYANGFVRTGEEPLIRDLERAIELLDLADKNFDPRYTSQQVKNEAKELLSICKERVSVKRKLKKATGKESSKLSKADKLTRRKQILHLSHGVQQRMNADKDALKLLSTKFAKDDYKHH